MANKAIHVAMAGDLTQGTLPDGEASVQLTSTLRYLVLL